MKKTIKIGGKDVALEVNGATPIYYNRIFHRNLFKEISAAEDQAKAAEIVPEIGYVMAMQAEGRQKEISEDGYIAWLESFALFDLVNGITSAQIVNLFLSTSNPSVDAKKKAD